MHLPRALARFNRRVTNPIQRRWAGVIPYHGIIEHVGRRSGRSYRTPVLTFRDGARGFVFVVGYGPDSDWVRNVLAAGGAGLVHRRRHYRLTNPRLVRGAEGRTLLPAPVRVACAVAGVQAVLRTDLG
ncbi:MAG: nitroreductase family deazaflavin-dependent oxidoreductase [Jatrophihabitans sp.]|nr:MAG: nitroreductase family deazaflavin-dependent oxidoreductase [Jatrophihabitans sp.]